MNKGVILVVEDEAIIAGDLSLKLRRLGYEVAATCASGEQAIEAVGRLSPDLVLMDIHLSGGVDGVEAAQEIRRRYALPVIYVTAHADDETLARAKIAEPYGYILKPYDERSLSIQLELAIYKRRAERELRCHREWLRLALSSIGDAVLATDAAGRVSFLNPMASALLGWETSEAQGRPCAEVLRLLDESTGLELEDPAARVLREKRNMALSNHSAVRTRSGRLVPVEDSAAPMLDGSGEVIGVVLVLRDVTERRRANERLRVSEERLRLATEAAHMFAWEANPQAGTMEWSDNAAAVIGCAPGELPAQPEGSFFFAAPEEEARVRKGWEEAISRREALYANDFRGRGEADAARYYFMHARFFYDSQGNPERVLGVTQDVTRRKQVNDMAWRQLNELMQARQQLARFVENGGSAD